jgi:hypothetical protein
MKMNYRPDQTHVHMSYGFQAQKESVDEGCCDRISGKFHTRGDFESMMKVLKKLGFKVKASKQTDTRVIDDLFPGEEEVEG